jgi:hypothetical protein
MTSAESFKFHCEENDADKEVSSDWLIEFEL